MRFAALALVLGIGCGGDDGVPVTGDCTEVENGAWGGNGSCWGMYMSATLERTGDGCSFTFTEWSMAMSAPTGGTISGDQVTFTGDDGWSSCTGTTDGTEFEVICDDPELNNCNLTVSLGG